MLSRYLSPVVGDLLYVQCLCVLSRYLSPVVEIWFILCWDVSYLRKAVYIKKKPTTSILVIIYCYRKLGLHHCKTLMMHKFAHIFSCWECRGFLLEGEGYVIEWLGKFSVCSRKCQGSPNFMSLFTGLYLQPEAQSTYAQCIAAILIFSSKTKKISTLQRAMKIIINPMITCAMFVHKQNSYNVGKSNYSSHHGLLIYIRPCSHNENNLPRHANSRTT